jgi:hypothetical protein
MKQLFVKTCSPQSGTIVFMANDDTTTNDIMRFTQEKTNVPVKNFYLTFGGRRIVPNRLLKDLKVQSDDTFRMYIKQDNCPSSSNGHYV